MTPAARSAFVAAEGSRVLLLEAVIPAKAGIHSAFRNGNMDSGFRRNDEN
jgi:hypothetical protein